MLDRMGLALALLLAASGWQARAAGANTRCVNHGGTGGCFSSIGAAISAAADGDMIQIAGGVSPYFERLTINKSLSLIGDSAAMTIIDGAQGGQVIRITTAVTVTLTNLTIRNGQAGPGNSDANYGAGIHNVLGHLTLNYTVVSGNRTGGGSLCCGGNGGGISSDNGSLTLNNSIVSGNATGSAFDTIEPGSEGGSGGVGGGIYNQNGPLTLNHSTITGNRTGTGAHGDSVGGQGGAGGGVASQIATVTLNHSTISDNTTGDGGTGASKGGDGGAGGGLFSFAGSLTIDDSTLSDNETGAGGASGGFRGFSGNGAGLMASFEPVTLTNSTISGNLTGHGLFGNDGGDGGGIFAYHANTVNLINVTLAYNSVDADQIGGAISNISGTVYVKNSLLAYNHSAFGVDNLTDCSGTVISQGSNVMMEPDCIMLPGPTGTTGDQFYVRGALLAPLADNGGPTQTNALVPGSPAIDAADNATCSPTDQRGFPRPVFGGTAVRCDVGAFELYRFGVRLALVVR